MPYGGGRALDRSTSFWLALCGVWLVAVVGADTLLDRPDEPPVVLVGLLVGAPLLASIRLNARRTALVALIAIVTANVLWRANGMPIGTDSTARFAALVCGCAFGILAARRREQLQALSEELRLNAARAEFLAEATTLLVSSLDYRATLAQVARAAVPALVDRCVIDLAGDARVADLGAGAAASAITVPIVWQEREIGTIGFSTRPGSRRLTEDDHTVAVDLAARAARAIEHARINAERDHIARTLQASLLPPALPQAPGLELAARYRPARGGADVGGDFYDCFPLGDGEWVALVGDVQGKGVEAATVTSLIHHSLRTIAMQEHSPAGMLARLNEVVLRRREGCHNRFCTLALVKLRERPDGALDACVALGGHPQPLVRRANGAVDPVGIHGTLIGAIPDVHLHDVDFVLAPGETLLLFSDGVTEARGDEGMLGEAGLAALLAGVGGGTAEQTCEFVDLAVRSYPPGDDVALLAVRARVESAAWRSKQAPSGPRSSASKASS
ncbi:SpoIIE family protein phosphatase [Solirubrobacter phytolaccae]|uniref:SpoIIE family protein phosphatase n=1 Tax=Solirubrobacter phytolaccae TaxID=1404360 RepID=A0A9X3NGT1_9ACTN|nr:GAF domain-containing SpoIIE family protein phosphatase [Solirubrobacter phytolaccae]MDA0185079.1 SpoIIE family protein phosphatase [Solirubrobacter phytolaccae]